MTTTPDGSATCSPRSAPNVHVDAARRLDADGLGRGDRREQVHELVTRGERHLELDAQLAREDRHARRIEVLEHHVGAEAHDVEVRRAGRARAPARRRGRPRPARAPAARPWPARRPASEPTSSRWTGPMLVITPTSGSAIRASSSICPNPRMPISSTSTSVPSRRGEHRQRQPDLGVEVRRVGGDAPVRRDQRRDQLLRRGLADRAGDADHGGVELAPPGGREPLQRQQRIGGGEHGAAGQPGGVLGRDQHAPRAGGQRVGGEPARRRRARRPGRRTGRPARSRACRSTARVGPPSARRRRATRRRPRRPGPRSRRSRRTYRRDRLARDRGVVERLLAAVLELLALLVALARDHDDVAGRGPARSRGRSSPAGRRRARPPRAATPGCRPRSRR